MNEIIAKQLGLGHVLIRLEKDWGSLNPNHRHEIREELFRLNPDSPEVQNLKTLPKLKEQNVSISHTRGIGGFALAQGSFSLGFDVESNVRIQESKLNRVDRYRQELETAPGFNFFWTAKEASFKCMAELFSLRALSDVQILDWSEISGNLVRFKAIKKGPDQQSFAEGLCWVDSGYTFALACVHSA
jgi:hypothetical protein